jgi:hypothetical protein
VEMSGKRLSKKTRTAGQNKTMFHIIVFCAPPPKRSTSC